MKNIILGGLGLALIVFLFMNSKKEKMPTVEPQNNVDQEVVEQTPNMGGGSINSVSMLTANTWIWEKTVMNDDTTIVPEKTDVFSLTFAADGNVSGTTDCNGFGGSYELGPDNTISFGPFMSTLMFCENSQEAIFSKNVSDSNMIFFTEEGNLVLLLPYDSGSVIFKK